MSSQQSDKQLLVASVFRFSELYSDSSLFWSGLDYKRSGAIIGFGSSRSDVFDIGVNVPVFVFVFMWVGCLPVVPPSKPGPKADTMPGSPA